MDRFYKRYRQRISSFRGAGGLSRDFIKDFVISLKRKSSSLKVIGFPPGFGTSAGGILTVCMAAYCLWDMLSLTGTYTSEGSQNDNWRKIMSLDVLKGTNINKIAALGI